jgi:TPR repeat protein
MVNAEVRLGDIYYYGEGGIPQNSRKAFMYYTRASLSCHHSVYVRYRVATMYELGDGIKQNLEKALKFYKQAVNELGREEFRNTRQKVAELTERLKQRQE